MDCLVNRIMCQSLNQVQPEGGVVNEIRERYVEIRNQLIDNAKKNKMMPFIAKMLLDAGIDSTYWNDVLKEYRLRNSKSGTYSNTGMSGSKWDLCISHCKFCFINIDWGRLSYVCFW